MPAFRFLGDEGEGRLRAAIALPAHDYYADLADDGAAMFRSIVMGHPFQDGNKRYAIVATQVFFFQNGALALLSQEQWELLALQTAMGALDREAIAATLRLYLFEMPPIGSDIAPQELVDVLLEAFAEWVRTTTPPIRRDGLFDAFDAMLTLVGHADYGTHDDVVAQLANRLLAIASREADAELG